MPSSEMLRRVVLVRTDVSEELSASINRVTRIGELGTTLGLLCHGFVVLTTLRCCGSNAAHFGDRPVHQASAAVTVPNGDICEFAVTTIVRSSRRI
jgi:hypothetical protein